MSDTWDVLVVGSGPAGAAAALALARGGARVALLERAALPRYKTCGGGLVPRALAQLPDEVQSALERRLHVAELNLLDGGPSFRVRRTRPVVSTAMRAELDGTLVEAAVRAGAALCDRSRVRALDEDGSGVTLRTEGETFRARWVVAADGVNGVVARLAGWPGAPSSVPALEAELYVDDATLERFSETLRFDFGVPPDGYGWVFPKRDHLSVGVLRMRQRERGPRGGIKATLIEYLRRVGLADSGRLELHGSSIPVAPRSGGASRGRVLLAGDAAGLADPITAEGISHALRSGSLAAAALLAGDGDLDRVRRDYQGRLDRHVLHDLRPARLLARLLYGMPSLRRAGFRVRGQVFCEALMEVASGRRTYRNLLGNPRSQLRLLTGILGRRRDGAAPDQAGGAGRAGRAGQAR